MTREKSKLRQEAQQKTGPQADAAGQYGDTQTYVMLTASLFQRGRRNLATRMSLSAMAMVYPTPGGADILHCIGSMPIRLDSR